MVKLTKESLALIKTIVIVIAVLFIVDRGVGFLMRHFYFRQQSGDGFLVTYALDSTKADILVLGSSRAKHTYDPKVFEICCNLDCFNAGRDGTEHILFSYCQFKAITARYKPSIVIFDIRPEDLQYNSRDYDLLSPLLPYFKSHPEIKDLILSRGPFERIKHISATYPFNSLIFQVIMGNTEMNMGRKPHYKGYIPFYEAKVHGKIDTLLIPDIDIDTNKINLIREVIQTCKQNEIRLMFVYSPTWHIVPESTCDGIISKLCEDGQAEYLNMSNLHEFLENPEYFYDRTHLNEKGSEVFTTKLASIIVRDVNILDN